MDIIQKYFENRIELWKTSIKALSETNLTKALETRKKELQELKDCIEFYENNITRKNIKKMKDPYRAKDIINILQDYPDDYYVAVLDKDNRMLDIAEIIDDFSENEDDNDVIWLKIREE